MGWKQILAGVCALALVAGCSSDGSGSEGAAVGDLTSTTVAPPGFEEFSGSVDAFYEAPDPLPAGQPGDLIRVQEVGAGSGTRTVRVMYHSNDAAGTDRPVTGLVTYPTAAAPPDGWPVISTAHGTTGIAPQCAPSRTVSEAPGWGVEGVWTATDYVGLGPVGELHPYLSKAAEGNAVIDIVTASQQLTDANAGSRWISIGHSQGGHGALSAHELAAERAPDLELAGTVALAPAAMLDRVYGGIDPIVTSILTMMGLYGGQSEHPDIDIADYLTPEVIEASEVFETGCLDEITNTMVPFATAGPFVADPRQTEPARSIFLANDVGNVAVEDVPLYMASGTLDDRVVIERARDLFARLCETGQLTELQIIEGADHGSIIPAVSDRITSFISDALAGRPIKDSCDDPPPGA